MGCSARHGADFGIISIADRSSVSAVTAEVCECEKTKLATISTAVAVLMLVFDIYWISNYSERATPDIDWLKIGGVLSVQVFAYLSARMRESLIRRGFNFKQDPNSISYRNYIPVIMLGIVCAALSISNSLLEMAIVSPHQNFPMARGDAGLPATVEDSLTRCVSPIAPADGPPLRGGSNRS